MWSSGNLSKNVILKKLSDGYRKIDLFTIRYRRKRSGKKCTHDNVKNNVKYGHINQVELKSNVDAKSVPFVESTLRQGPMHKEHTTHSYMFSKEAQEVGLEHQLEHSRIFEYFYNIVYIIFLPQYNTNIVLTWLHSYHSSWSISLCQLGWFLQVFWCRQWIMMVH